MNTVDTLLTNCYLVLALLAVIYHVSMVVLALRNRPTPWTTLAQLGILHSNISGRAVLIMFGMAVAVAAVVGYAGLPKLATATVLAGVLTIVFQLSTRFTARKLRSMRLSTVR